MKKLQWLLLVLLSCICLVGYSQQSSGTVDYGPPRVEGTVFLIQVLDQLSEQEKYAVFHKIPYDKTPFGGTIKAKGGAYCMVSRARTEQELSAVEEYLKSSFQVVNIERTSVSEIEAVLGYRLNPAKRLE